MHDWPLGRDSSAPLTGRGCLPGHGEALFLGPSIAAAICSHRLHLVMGTKRSPPPRPSSVSSVPSDREQAALEKTNIYSSNGSWHRLFPATGVWLTPWDGHNRRHPGRQADVPPDTSIQDQMMSSRRGRHVPRSHLTHLSPVRTPSERSASYLPRPVGQLCEKVQLQAGPVSLAPGSCSDPWGL